MTTHIAATDPYLEIAKGNVPGHRVEHRFGRSLPLALNSVADVWIPGGLKIWQTVASPIDIVSDDVADNGNPAGAGAHIIHVNGLDAAFARQGEDVVLNGTTPVQTVNSYVRNHRAHIVKQGLAYDGGNVGTISLTYSGTGDPSLGMVPGFGQTEFAGHTIPDGEAGFLISAGASTDARSGKSVSMVLIGRVGADDITTPFNPFRAIFHIEGLAGPVGGRLDVPTVIPPKADLWWRVLEVEANDTAVAASISMIMVELSLLGPGLSLSMF